VWAWRRYRLRSIGRSVDLMLTLFPFETRLYADHGIPACFTGHPLADEIPFDNPPAPARGELGLDAARPAVALLPGSRASEIRRLLPLFLDTAALCRDSLPQLQWILPVASPALAPLCRTLLGRSRHQDLAVTVCDGRARAAMQAADAALVASGTATLECALVKRPMVVAYRMNALSCALIRRMLRVPWFSLPNNLIGRPQVPEYLQEAATPRNLADELIRLLRHPEQAERQIAPFAELHRSLRRGAAGQAAAQILARAAE
jgi:lipid-A-disaccharide synthase